VATTSVSHEDGQRQLGLRSANTCFEPVRCRGIPRWVSVCQLLAPLWNPVVSSLFPLEFESSGRKIPCPSRGSRTESAVVGDCVVYVVDNNAGVCQSLARPLARDGFAVRSFDNSTFHSVASTLPRGCILQELRRPEMQGLELQERLVACGVSHPLVVTTGDGDVPAAVRAMKAGAADVLQNPALTRTSSKPSNPPSRNKTRRMRWERGAMPQKPRGLLNS
jgi:PleD family two-component response regulator